MKKMTIIIIITVLFVVVLGLFEMALTAGEPQKTAGQAQKHYAANELLPYIIDPDTAKGKLLAAEQYKNCPPLRPERFRRRVKMLWGIDINDYPADAILPVGGYSDLITLSKRYQLLSGHTPLPPPIEEDDGPAFAEHPDYIYEPLRKFIFFGDDDAKRTLLDYKERINSGWDGGYEFILSSDFLIALYHNMPFSQDVGLINYNDKNTMGQGLLTSDIQIPTLTLISVAYSDNGLLKINFNFGDMPMIKRISDMRFDLLSLYIRHELSKGRILSDNPYPNENEIFLGRYLLQNGLGEVLLSLCYSSNPLYGFTNPWHNYSAARGISAYLAFLLQLQNKFTDKRVIKYMSGQFDESAHLARGEWSKIIRKNIKENNYYGYTLLREFCENPMREMPTLEKIGTSFRANVKEKNTLLLLEPFAVSYDIDTVQPVEFLKAYEMGHDDYWFVEVEKPVESPVAGTDGYAKILDRTETVYGYIPKTQVKVLTDADILQWETMHDKTKSKQGIINDPDGYVNIRKEQSTNSEILEQIKNREVFNYWELPTNWFVVETEAGLRGFVYKDRIKEYVNPEGWTIHGKLTD